MEKGEKVEEEEEEAAERGRRGGEDGLENLATQMMTILMRIRGLDDEMHCSPSQRCKPLEGGCLIG